MGTCPGAAFLGLHSVAGTRVPPWHTPVPNPSLYTHPSCAGHVPLFLRTDIPMRMVEWTRQYGGVYRLRFLWSYGVLVTDPALARAVLQVKGKVVWVELPLCATVLQQHVERFFYNVQRWGPPCDWSSLPYAAWRP